MTLSPAAIAYLESRFPDVVRQAVDATAEPVSRGYRCPHENCRTETLFVVVIGDALVCPVCRRPGMEKIV